MPKIKTPSGETATTFCEFSGMFIDATQNKTPVQREKIRKVWLKACPTRWREKFEVVTEWFETMRMIAPLLYPPKKK